MKDTLIQFETAKLAKEKGFNIKSRYGYLLETKKLHTIENPALWYKDRYASVSQSLLQKWLREECRLIVVIYVDINEKFYWYVYKSNGEQALKTKPLIGKYKTYEQALEKGLIETLKLIK